MDRRVDMDAAPDPTRPLIHVIDGSIDLAAVNRREAMRCALSRICAACGRPLSFPIAFVGDDNEHAQGYYSRPGMHEICAQALIRMLRVHLPTTSWSLRTSGSFTIHRPSGRDGDTCTRFRIQTDPI